MSTVPIPDPGGVHVTVRGTENVIDVWDSDELSLSLTFTEARKLVDDLVVILTTFAQHPDLANRSHGNDLPASWGPQPEPILSAMADKAHRVAFSTLVNGAVEWQCGCGVGDVECTPAEAERAAGVHRAGAS